MNGGSEWGGGEGVRGRGRKENFFFNLKKSCSFCFS